MKPTDRATPVADEVIAEVHRHKRAIMAECGDDVEKLLQGIRRRQKGNPRLVSSQPPSCVVREDSPAPTAP